MRLNGSRCSKQVRGGVTRCARLRGMDGSSMERAPSNDGMTGPRRESVSPGLRLDKNMREAMDTTPASLALASVPHGITLQNGLETAEPPLVHEVVPCGACTSGLIDRHGSSGDLQHRYKRDTMAIQPTLILILFARRSTLSQTRVVSLDSIRTTLNIAPSHVLELVYPQ